MTLQLRMMFSSSIYYSAGDVILRPGLICRKLYFIQAGLVYAYSNDESERILWYEFGGNSFTDVISFYSRSESNISSKVAENKTKIASISFDDLDTFIFKTP